ncbi:MAG: hypothetical protein EZS28_002671 [Streblomastix strix]|uniref:Uncharacterized protein n=1 Tax=Streblomastix strix TaxID=222440 RepID=A0A5J4X3A5_9EUKA|nr:MAG: hypothetical protein EZS28_002671 [Streblomastix strix]
MLQLKKKNAMMTVKILKQVKIKKTMKMNNWNLIFHVGIRGGRAFAFDDGCCCCQESLRQGEGGAEDKNGEFSGDVRIILDALEGVDVIVEVEVIFVFFVLIINSCWIEVFDDEAFRSFGVQTPPILKAPSKIGLLDYDDGDIILEGGIVDVGINSQSYLSIVFFIFIPPDVYDLSVIVEAYPCVDYDRLGVRIQSLVANRCYQLLADYESFYVTEELL